MAKWTNYGDINFLSHGGCLVRPHWEAKEIEKHPSLADMYDVFALNTEAGENGDQFSAKLCCVDLDDIDEKVKEEILYAIGEEDKIDLPNEEIMSSEMWAKEMVECTGLYQQVAYNNQYPVAWQDFIIAVDDLEHWLYELGAGEFI